MLSQIIVNVFATIVILDRKLKTKNIDFVLELIFV